MNISTLLGVAFAAVLAGCGGGGSSGSTSATTSTTTTSTLPPTSVPRVVPVQNDYFTYSMTVTPAVGSPSSYYFTRAYSTVNPDGSLVRADTFSNGTSFYTQNFDTSWGITSYSYLSGSTTICTNSPSNIVVPIPATVGTNWNSNFTETCTGGVSSTSSFNNTGSMTAIESVTTPAGTFTAGKYVFTQTQVVTGVYTWAYNFTCWVDTALGRTVKCQDTNVYTPVIGTPVSRSRVFVLEGYSAAGLSSVPTVARFAGNWTGSYTGNPGTSNVGTCSSLTVSIGGAITGSCTDNFAGAFTVTGTVNTAGTASLTASTGVTFSGTLSTISGSGTWIGVPNGGGTWTASHK